MPRTPWNLAHVLTQTSGLDKREARCQLRYLTQRHFNRDMVSVYATYLLICVATVPLTLRCLRLTDSLSARWDIWVGLGFLFAMSIPMLFAMPLLFRRRHRRMLWHMSQPACFRCGYSLKGLGCTSSGLLVIVCPECGNASPCSADAVGSAAANDACAPTVLRI